MSRRCSSHRAAPLFLIGVLVWGGASFILESAGATEQVAGQLWVRDALTTPGHPVRIEARLVRRSFLGQEGLGGEQLEFTVAGKRAGTAMTGGDGRAFLEYTPRMRGNHPVTVRLTGSKRVESVEATAMLACWERRRPILLVDIEALGEERKAPQLPLPSLPLEINFQDRPSPAPGAVDELKRLTDFFFNVVYLSRSGPGEFGEKGDDREWLRQYRFPAGLLRTVNPGKTALADLLDLMRDEGWDNLKAGVGRTREFAEVLDEHRMTVVIVPEPDRGEFPKKTQMAKDWQEVRKKLQK